MKDSIKKISQRERRIAVNSEIKQNVAGNIWSYKNIALFQNKQKDSYDLVIFPVAENLVDASVDTHNAQGWRFSDFPTAMQALNMAVDLAKNH
jgi:hypothetical protein